ncbi:hypothetical protein K3728_00160 [Rhodobacteraceae bacterium M385]|nr:hypothetical protein K3728_00160 [Rhodobacteraceae bacterium M385]
MKNIAIIAALAASIAAPAVAQSTSTAFAIAHFNQSADAASDVVDFRGNDSTRVSTEGTSALAEAFAIFNQSADSADELTGQNGATVVSGTPSYGSDIFDRLAAADDDN